MTLRRSRPPIRAILVTAGVVGWLAFAYTAARMYPGTPPGSGFDLELLIVGGRQVAAGASPYDPAMLAGRSVEIATLFYSYPPLVAQAFAALAWLPSWSIFAGTVAAASLAAVGAGVAVARRFGSTMDARLLALPIAALLPFWFPYTVGMLFGNLDIFFPALYGLMLIAGSTGRNRALEHRWLVAGGVALALASVTKLHPAVLGLWFLVRGLVELRRRGNGPEVAQVGLPSGWRVAGIAVVAVLALFGASLVVGGLNPWFDYVTVLRAGTSVDLLDPRNLGPAVQVVMLLGLGPSAVGPIQVGVVAIALLVTVVAAIRVDDPLESFTWAASASFIVLPVTWFHHFAALIPCGIAAIARARDAGESAQRNVLLLTAASFGLGAIGFGMPPTWLLVPLVVAASRLSRARSTPALVDQPGATADAASDG